MPLDFANTMHPNKISCTPVYIHPKKVKEEAFIKLAELEALELSGRWVDDSTFFLNENGSFSHKVIEEGSLKARTQKASFLMANLVSSPERKASSEIQKLHIVGRGLLVALLAHAWL